MSRSLGHRPYKKTDSETYYRSTRRGHRPRHRHRGAWVWHTLEDLRFPDAELRLAAEEGRRPRPSRIRRSKVAYDSGRALARSLESIAVYTQEMEGGARARLRAEAAKAVKTANARKFREFDPAFDIAPFRSRHRALWDAS